MSDGRVQYLKELVTRLVNDMDAGRKRSSPKIIEDYPEEQAIVQAVHDLAYEQGFGYGFELAANFFADQIGEVTKPDFASATVLEKVAVVAANMQLDVSHDLAKTIELRHPASKPPIDPKAVN